MTAPAPTVLWRASNDRREHARAVVLPGGPPHTLVFFVNDRMDRAENHESLDLAIFRSDEIRRTLAAEGWREET